MDNGGYKSNLSLNEKLLMGVIRVAEDFKKRSSAIFKNYGLTFAQYNVLRVLNSSKDGVNTVTNVGKIMLVTGANMTGLAKRLERDGYLIRKRHPQDERVTLLEISPKGKQALLNIEREKEENLRRYVGRFSDAEKRAILAQLKDMVAHKRGAETEG
ncbi:MAG: MarR family transcriptional regulator [Desulfarculus sp.]|nr:MarR family transcriptional regulator [Desulfarculus sp.]